MDEWIAGQKLLENWNIQDEKLFDYVKMGLQPYYKQWHGPKPPPNIAEMIAIKNTERKSWKKIIANSEIPVTVQGELEQNPITGNLSCDESTFVPAEKFNFAMEKQKIKDLESEIEDLKESEEKFSWKDYELPLDPQEAIQVINDLVESVYATDEVEAFEKKHHVLFKIGSKPAEYVFSRKDERDWFVIFHGEKAIIEDVIGMTYIALLLESSPRPIDNYVLENYKLIVVDSEMQNELIQEGEKFNKFLMSKNEDDTSKFSIFEEHLSLIVGNRTDKLSPERRNALWIALQNIYNEMLKETGDERLKMDRYFGEMINNYGMVKIF
jgi:hypothetical protein